MSEKIKTVLRQLAISGYPQSFAFVAIATLISELAFGLVPEASLTLIYLLAVLVSAQMYGLWPALMASGLAVAAWDFFFTQPYFSLELSSERDIFTLLFFMVVALVVSGMTAHIQRQNRRLTTLAETKESLYEFIQVLAATDTAERIATYLTSFVSSRLGRNIIVVLDSNDGSRETKVFPPEAIGHNEDFLNHHYLEAELHASRGPQSLVTRDATFLPLTAIRGRIGAIVIPETLKKPLSLDEKESIAALLSQTSVAIERIWLAQEHEASKIAAEAERIRNALLLSISHDLKTPLTTIIGSLSTLELMAATDGDANHMELTSLALTESQRLERFITNLLDMTKLESGGLNVRYSLVSIQDVVVSVIQRAEQILSKHMVVVDVQDALQPITANFDLLEQAIFNIVDNAAKYSLSQTEIEIRAFSDLDWVVVTIKDEGGGISAELSKVLFSKFARASQEDRSSPGTGLGLAIARGFVEAQGGSITAANRKDRNGAVFTIKLPANIASPDGPSVI